MNWYSVVFGLTVAASVASSFAGERERWIPGPSSLHYGAIADGYLLSYQWEPSDAPETWREPPSLAGRRVRAERWLAAEKWEPKDIQWFLADLAEGSVRPLKEVMPHEAEVLSRQRNAAPPHHAPHRWRWAWGRLWVAKFDISGAFTPSVRARLLGMVFDPRRPATSHSGSSIWPAPYPHDSGKVPSALPSQLSRMRVVHDMVDRGMWWWDEWRTAESPWLNRIDYDVLPTSVQQATLVVLVENGMSVWTTDWQWATTESGELRWRGGGRWKRVGSFPAPFIEPFHLAAAEGAYFLVTDESGEVYAAEEVDGQWKTRTVWNDPARPIVAMLTSGDGSAPFVFGKDFYFQLARKVEPQPCKDVTQGRPDLGDPMRTVLECAQVLHKAGLLTDTKPPE